MGNSSGNLYSQEYQIQTTAQHYGSKEDDGWMVVKVLNESDNEFDDEFDDESDDKSNDEFDDEFDDDLELYKEVCQLLSEDGADVDWVCFKIPPISA